MNAFLAKLVGMITPYLLRNVNRKGGGIDAFRKRKPVFFLFIVCLVLFGQFVYIAEQAFGLSFRNKEKKELLIKITEENEQCLSRVKKIELAPYYVACKPVVDNNPSE
jgi:hypothetical protein